MTRTIITEEYIDLGDHKRLWVTAVTFDETNKVWYEVEGWTRSQQGWVIFACETQADVAHHLLILGFTAEEIINLLEDY